jgi:secreted Zn-dependent insulinase-like peptidase
MVKTNREQLYNVTKGIKRQQMNLAKKGDSKALKKKTEIYKLIASKLGLTSERTLWSGPHSEYLEGWFLSFQADIEEALKNSTVIPTESTLTEDKISNYKEIIKALEIRVKELTIENNELRSLTIKRFERI